MDYYRLLGVEKNATSEDIKIAYRKLAKAYHPDLNKAENASYLFTQIKRAYETLYNPVTRKEYDLSMGFEGIKYTYEPNDTTQNINYKYTQNCSETKDNTENEPRRHNKYQGYTKEEEAREGLNSIYRTVINSIIIIKEYYSKLPSEFRRKNTEVFFIALLVSLIMGFANLFTPAWSNKELLYLPIFFTFIFLLLRAFW